MSEKWPSLQMKGLGERQTLFLPTSLSCYMNWCSLSQRHLGSWAKVWNRLNRKNRMNSLNRKWCEEISVRNLHSCINRNNWCPNYFNHMTFTVLWKKQSGCLEYRFKLSHCTVLITTCFFFFLPKSLPIPTSPPNYMH